MASCTHTLILIWFYILIPFTGGDGMLEESEQRTYISQAVGKWHDCFLVLLQAHCQHRVWRNLLNQDQLLDLFCKSRYSSSSGVSEDPNKKTTGRTLQNSLLWQSITSHLLCILLVPPPPIPSSCFFTSKPHRGYCRSPFFQTLRGMFLTSAERWRDPELRGSIALSCHQPSTAVGASIISSCNLHHPRWYHKSMKDPNQDPLQYTYCMNTMTKATCFLQ